MVEDARRWMRPPGHRLGAGPARQFRRNRNRRFSRRRAAHGAGWAAGVPRAKGGVHALDTGHGPRHERPQGRLSRDFTGGGGATSGSGASGQFLQPEPSRGSGSGSRLKPSRHGDPPCRIRPTNPQAPIQHQRATPDLQEFVMNPGALGRGEPGRARTTTSGHGPIKAFGINIAKGSL